MWHKLSVSEQTSHMMVTDYLFIIFPYSDGLKIWSVITPIHLMGVVREGWRSNYARQRFKKKENLKQTEYQLVCPGLWYTKPKPSFYRERLRRKKVLVWLYPEIEVSRLLTCHCLKSLTTQKIIFSVANMMLTIIPCKYQPTLNMFHIKYLI